MPYIYLIHCRASVNSNENVYKIGKSFDFNKRLEGYDKGTIPLFSLYVSECDNFEKHLINLFGGIFTLRKDYGNEYFEGNINQMINLIISEFNNIKELVYSPSLQITEDNTKQKCIDNPSNLIKIKKQMRIQLNKIKDLNELNLFYNNISSYSTEYQYSTYFSDINSYIQQYTQQTQMANQITKKCNPLLTEKQFGGKQKIIRFGDYVESRGYINRLVTDYCYKNKECVKLVERILIS